MWDDVPQKLMAIPHYVGCCPTKINDGALCGFMRLGAPFIVHMLTAVDQIQLHVHAV